MIRIDLGGPPVPPLPAFTSEPMRSSLKNQTPEKLGTVEIRPRRPDGAPGAVMGDLRLIAALVEIRPGRPAGFDPPSVGFFE
jgi:hypothetical protein